VGTWSLDPLPILAAVAALVLFGQGFGRVRRRRRELAGRGRAALFCAGVLVAVLALISPLDRLGEDRLLSAHMLQHLLLADVAPLLIVLGLRGPLTVFLIPQRPLRALASVHPLRRLVSFLLRPWVSFAVWALVMAAWHVPAAYDAAIAHPAVHAAEHASLFLAGLLVWTQIIDPAGHARRSPGRRAVFAGVVLLAGMGLSEVLLLAGPLYPHYEHVFHRPLGFTAAEDQRRAALLMMAEQIATLGTAAALLLWSHAERVAREMAAA
jgi:cytochrome c oxidase assembly factor CtaG